MSFDAFVLNEGGNVFGGGTRRVSAKEAADTAKHLSDNVLSKLGEVGSDIVQVGSSVGGHEAGDLDFVYDLPEMRKRLGSESAERRFYDRVRMEVPDLNVNFIKGLGITSVEYPVAGEPAKGYVQVDLIPVESMDWGMFAHVRPDKSKYKGAQRNLLFAAMCAVWMQDEKKEDGQLISWTGYMFDVSRGFFKVEKTMSGARGQLLKNAKKEGQELITTDPERFLHVIFDGNVSRDQVESFESLWRIMVNDEKWKKKVSAVAKKLDEFLRRADLATPEEIKEYL
jgi:hypothetical protein